MSTGTVGGRMAGTIEASPSLKRLLQVHHGFHTTERKSRRWDCHHGADAMPNDRATMARKLKGTTVVACTRSLLHLLSPSRYGPSGMRIAPQVSGTKCCRRKDLAKLTSHRINTLGPSHKSTHRPYRLAQGSDLDDHDRTSTDQGAATKPAPSLMSVDARRVRLVHDRREVKLLAKLHNSSVNPPRSPSMLKTESVTINPRFALVPDAFESACEAHP
jgi:hypothetical protein